MAAVTGADVGSFVSIVAASVLVMALIVTGIPALARVLFRHRVEALRDECVDAILDGKLRPEPTVESFIRSTEQIGSRARRLTLLRAITMYIALVRLQTPRSVLPAQATYSDLEPDEARIFSDLERRYKDAFWSYLSWGSATAWIIAPLLKVIFRRVNPKADVATEREVLPMVLSSVTKM
jgi:hypothetical protein